jgi:hypothetical protein
MAVDKAINKFLETPTEGTAYCPTKGDMCEARADCLQTFHDARVTMRFKESFFLSLVHSLALANPYGLGAPAHHSDPEAYQRAKYQAMEAASLLARNCNIECVLEDTSLVVPPAGITQPLIATHQEIVI